jgi:hypothetical protein
MRKNTPVFALIGISLGLCSPSCILFPFSTPAFVNMIDVTNVYFVKQTILADGQYVNVTLRAWE